MPRLDRVHASTQSDDMRDEVWDAVRVDAAHDEPIAVLVDRAERRELVLRAARKTRDAYAHSVAAQQLVERPLGDDLPAIDDRELAVEQQHLTRGEPRLIAEELGQVTDAAARGALADGLAEDLGAAGRRAREPEEQFHGGRLAGAVRPEETEDRAARD